MSKTNKKVGRFEIKPIFRLLLAISIITFAASMLAVSCGKTGGGGNSANNSGGGNGGCTDICPTTNLTLAISGGAVGYAKVNGNTVTVNATRLATVITPHSDANDSNRGYEDTSANNARAGVFNIDYPGDKVALVFVSRAHVTKDTITMAAVTTGTSTLPKCTSSESGDNALAAAAGGAHCRAHYTNDNQLLFSSYLGTVFNNTNTNTHARGLMKCSFTLSKINPATDSAYPITDTLTFQAANIYCSMAVVNSAGAGAAAAEIDDAWVGDDASVKEVELYAIGINVEGKGIAQWSDAPGYGLDEFKKAHDNAAFKRLLRNNEWADLKFKVKIVTAAAF